MAPKPAPTGLTCQACGTRLLWPAPLCGFCTPEPPAALNETPAPRGPHA